MDKIVKLNNKDVELIDGGSNSWQQNVGGIWGSASAGCALGALIGGPVGCFVGAYYGTIGWTAVTGLTGGFGR